jgi:glycosyltransferase involved in cell wall biosynthesis
MKVCLLPSAIQGPGGVGKHLACLSRYLEQKGIEVLPPQQWAAADLIHAHAAAATPRPPDVYTNHGIWPIRPDMANWEKEQNQTIFHHLRAAYRVIAVSRWTWQSWYHLTGIQAQIIPNGVDPLEWREIPALSWRQRLGIGSRPLVVWGKHFVSQAVDPSPALRLAIARPQIALVMPLKPELLTWYPANVYPIGPQPFPAMQALLAECDAYLSTSVENCPTQVIEAMYLDKPVVGFDQGGLPEILPPQGNFLVQPNDLPALALALDQALDQERNDNRSWVEAHFLWPDLVEKVIACYQDALEEKHAEADPQQPLCTIVISLYNKRPYLAETLQSVRQQTCRRLQVIIVDDGSTDGSQEEAERLTANFPFPVTLTSTLQPRSGPALARNLGLSLASTPYLCCLDADDTIAPTFIERLVQALQARPDAALAYSGMTTLGSDGVNFLPSTPFSLERLLKGNFIPCCNVFRRKAFLATRGYDPWLEKYGPSWEDYDLWLQMAKLGWPFVSVPDALFTYRLLPTGRAARSEDRAPYLRAAINFKHRDLYPPLVSIVIPCYNYARFLGEAIQSALDQTFIDLEVIVVDDGSQEEEEIAQICASFGPAVRLIRQPNRGLAAARNAGFAAAQGQWIVPLDADDKLDSTFLDKMLRATELNPNFFAYCDMWLWSNGQTRHLPAEEFDLDLLLRRITFPCSILVHKSAWEKAGGYQEAMTRAGGWEDWEFAIRLARLGICGRHVPEPLLFYRQHSEQQMRLLAEEKKDILRETLRSLHPDLYAGLRPPGCCQKAGKKEADRQQPGRNGLIEVEFLGQSRAKRSFRTPEGKVYRFSRAENRVLMPASDARWFAQLQEFRVHGLL